MRRPVVRATAIVLIVVVAAAVTAWRVCPSPYERFGEDTVHSYRDLVWASDGWIYLLATGGDSESEPGLARVRDGHELDLPRVTIPGCAEDYPSIDGLFAFSSAVLGLMSWCGASDRVVMASYAVQTGEVSVVGWYSYRGTMEVSWRGDGVGYGVAACGDGDGDGIVELRTDMSVCLHGNGSRRPVAQDDTLFFVGGRCGSPPTDPPNVAVCRWHRSVDRLDIVACGFTTIQNVAVHSASGRLAVTGRRGSQQGVWLVDPDRQLRRIIDGPLADAAFSPDGQHVAAVQRSDGWFSSSSAVVVVPAGG